MRKQPLFYGACTALVTPFLNNEINDSMLEQLLKRQMDSGIQSIVICGTTGESPTLSDQEKITLFSRAKEIVQDHCLILAGTGSNCTEHAVGLSIAAEQAGADGLLVVSPYYNKATPDGLVTHYSAVAGAIHIPVILYNVPSRTGVDISVDTCKSLAEIPNLVGIKEACGDISKVSRILSNTELAVWSGNDDQTVPVMALGGSGVISVASNVIPRQMHDMTQAALAGDYTTAAALQRRYQKLMDLLFCQVNPIPAKAAVAAMGICRDILRLPLTPMEEPQRSKLYEEMRKLGIEV